MLNLESGSLKMAEAVSADEWNVVRGFRNKNFFEPRCIEDPYTWTFNHVDHRHFLLYDKRDVVAYAHIQLWPKKRAALRIIVVEEVRRKNHVGSTLLTLCEQWLRQQGYHSIHAESSKSALSFYRKNNYGDMPFNDPDGYQADPLDTAVGKML